MVFNKKELDTSSKLDIVRSYVRETNSAFGVLYGSNVFREKNPK